jgi:Phosphotransferase enzyme family
LLASEANSYNIANAEQIRQILIEKWRSGDPKYAQLSVKGPVASGNSSKIFLGLSGGLDSPPLAIKVFLHPQSERHNRARIYFDALSELDAFARCHKDFGVPAPLGLLEEHGIVITEWISGPNLQRVVEKGSLVEIRQAAQKAGFWLCRLKCAAGFDLRPMDTMPSLARLQAWINSSPRLAKLHSVRQTMQILKQTATVAEVEPVIWSRSHGDFKPENLLLHEGRLFGIDLDLLYNTPSVRDAAHFINHLHLLLLKNGRVHHLVAVPSLVDAVRIGYGAKADLALPYAALRWERLRNALDLFVGHREWAHRPLRSWAGSLSLRWLIRQLTRDLIDVQFQSYTNRRHP